MFGVWAVRPVLTSGALAVPGSRGAGDLPSQGGRPGLTLQHGKPGCARAAVPCLSSCLPVIARPGTGPLCPLQDDDEAELLAELERIKAERAEEAARRAAEEAAKAEAEQQAELVRGNPLLQEKLAAQGAAPDRPARKARGGAGQRWRRSASVRACAFFSPAAAQLPPAHALSGPRRPAGWGMCATGCVCFAASLPRAVDNAGAPLLPLLPLQTPRLPSSGGGTTMSSSATRRGASPRRRSASSTTPSATISTSASWSGTSSDVPRRAAAAL